MKNSPALDAPLRTEAQARAELGEPLSDAELEVLRETVERTKLDVRVLPDTMRALIARLDLAEAQIPEHGIGGNGLKHLLGYANQNMDALQAENTWLKADVTELVKCLEDIWRANNADSPRCQLGGEYALRLNALVAYHRAKHGRA